MPPIIRPLWADQVPGEPVERSWENGALYLHPEHPHRHRYRVYFAFRCKEFVRRTPVPLLVFWAHVLRRDLESHAALY